MRNILVPAAAQAYLVQKVLDRVSGQLHPALDRSIAKVVGNGSGKKIRGLGDHSDATAQLKWRNFPVIAAFELNRPPGWFVQAIEQPEERRFPGAAWPRHHQHASRAHCDRHIIHDALACDLTGKTNSAQDGRRRHGVSYARLFTSHSRTLRTTDSGASTSNCTVPSVYLRLKILARASNSESTLPSLCGTRSFTRLTWSSSII